MEGCRRCDIYPQIYLQKLDYNKIADSETLGILAQIESPGHLTWAPLLKRLIIIDYLRCLERKSLTWTSASAVAAGSYLNRTPEGVTVSVPSESKVW